VNIVELVQAIGHERINVQVLDQCITHAKATKQGTMVTFGCKVPVADLGMLGPPEKRALILWVDAEALQSAATSSAEAATETGGAHG